jgi:hypothetical protein
MDRRGAGEKRVAKRDPGSDAALFRGKARDILAKADDSNDRIIAGELKLLAERYLDRAVELDGTASRRTRPTPRRRKPRAGPPPLSAAYRDDR